ncbi:bifunctional DNA primase/polymerase [Saccharopolyspora indica]|uniref:bifunctional DNA primase/polymerase n=1 Tax=Saccharopolyspora indica TaxID=1229659 RepID=UPI0022EB7D28|nr:bifunctional DNA primase/polymerase [Saccharopolyspora indica]MDA3648665.1 bifunctional DNA primase/polymerase [Saccharopolyspora indica]
MRWSAERWQGAFRGVPAHPAGLTSSRIELRVQAIGFASRGWPVLPGTYPDEDHWIGRHGRQEHGPMPVHRDWQTRLGTNPDEVTAWWAEHPYSLLIATGHTVDALEVDAALGRAGASVLRALGFPVPIVATPRGRWYFLMASGGELAAELADVPGIRLHGKGSWVAMPPTAYPGGAVHWRVKPEVCAWRLPTPDFVQDALRTGRENLDNDADVAELLAARR